MITSDEIQKCIHVDEKVLDKRRTTSVVMDLGVVISIRCLSLMMANDWVLIKVKIKYIKETHLNTRVVFVSQRVRKMGQPPD